MTDLIRPEIRAILKRWSEVLAAGAVVLLGTWWGVTAFGILRWVGLALALCGAALAFAAWQRLRFSQGGGGPGIVTVDERRIVYYGPEDGGVADLDLLLKLELDPAAAPGPAWVLRLATGETLEIPVNAEGADALFDVFAALPGLRNEDVLAVLGRIPDGRVTLWSAPKRRLH